MRDEEGGTVVFPSSRVSRPSPPVLLAAFKPFGGDNVNTSQQVAERLAQGDPAIRMVVLPVVRGAAEDAALAALRALAEAGTPPRLIVALGEARSAREVRLEKVAINWDDFRIADNAGNQPRDEPIRPGGPAAYFATLPVAPIAARLNGATPVPVVVSLSAGSFLCNHVAYAVSDALATGELPKSVCRASFGFVHVPTVRPGDGPDVRSLEAITVTVRAVLDAASGVSI